MLERVCAVTTIRELMKVRQIVSNIWPGQSRADPQENRLTDSLWRCLSDSYGNITTLAPRMYLEMEMQ